ncbi:hypothetical protein CYLTODRAFT_441396 [Cylindrobasidium torrendii FP15055 ss-10]|uniref:Transmembrane protein n=1 Tax=Cylindrobasidium torrendii FP15055 ss-10 TaxID=1314674 RepID=A0A0D7BMD6_9AGAR|nr:hypothetical protein CYLTODRAFT_441396 [Cylindrobasidium torrendii FP15055 ss-10]
MPVDHTPPPSPPPPKRSRNAWIPVAAGGLLLAALPLSYFAFRRSHHGASALAKAPPRRASSASSSGIPSGGGVSAAPPVAGEGEARRSINIREIITDVIRPGSSAPRARPPLEVVLRMVTAFGVATAGISALAATTVYGTMYAMGVNNVQEFSYRMRIIMAHRLPLLSSRIQNLHVYEGEDDAASPPEDVQTWNWDAAKQRLQDVYDREGAVAWSEAALEEMELEARLERWRRKGLDGKE